LARIALPLAPFQLKCLLSDALVVSTEKAHRLGVGIAPRSDEFLVPLARYNANQLFPSRHREPVLITGAASGIGACLARQLYTRGYQLLLADRNEAPLRERCQAYPPAKPWVVDLANPSLAENLARVFSAELPWPAVIINNAGVGWRGDSWDGGAAIAQTVIGVNAAAPTVISNFFLRQTPAPVTVVNIASTAAFQPLPYMAAYAAAKAYVLSFSLALEAELRAAGRRDRVLTIVPAGTNTAFQAAAGVATNPREKLLSPDQVAAAILQGLDGKTSLLMIGGRGRAMSLAASLVPLRFQAQLWQKLMQKMR
jgi:short-subunit dehydrogenase